MDLSIIIYILLILVYRAAEYLAMSRSGSIDRRSKPEASALLIAVPYYAIIIGPMIEYFWFDLSPGIVFMLLGGFFLMGATVVRYKAHLDLGKAFSMYLEKYEDVGIVRNGLYAHIRHPLYFANILLFIACPLFLQSTFTWALTLLGLLGVLIRIRLEERFLQSRAKRYEEYKSETWALIPGLY
ncbi:MAG: isoprenylcysteine carboxylmethyltransferase family protein [Anaerolineales bacterium]|jgi:protein-S-isoprenylcysteine O-methyltransferase Ste14